MRTLLQQLVNGIAVGGIYGLIAVGYSLIFGVARVFNIAHGEVAILGAYAGLVVARATGGNLFLVAAGAVAAAALAGYLLERLAIRPVIRGAWFATLLTTIGAGMVIESGLRILFTSQTQTFPVRFATPSVEVGGLLIGTPHLLVIAISVVLMIGLDRGVYGSRMGQRLRAMAENQEMAATLGVNTDRMRVGVLVVSSALAGVTGVLLAVILGFMTPRLGLQLAIKGLIILIVGGMGSVRGAMAVGVLLGMTEVLTAAYISSSFRDLVAFMMLIVVLLVRPQGLFGSPAASRA